MSVQFGRWNWNGEDLAPEQRESVRRALDPYGPDSNEVYRAAGLTLIYCAFRTTRESHYEKQPYVHSSGRIFLFDGRLDNRAELLGELGITATHELTDVAIAATANQKWGVNAFGKLIGDWALSVWEPDTQSLILSKDSVGTRHLYYRLEDNQITWCTLLQPFVQFANSRLSLNEGYLARWLRYVPTVHETPFNEIRVVPASSWVSFQLRKHGINSVIHRYWSFNHNYKIRYRSDAEYEEHFRTVLRTAVTRRLRSDRPVLAELSGGMDSSAIVCVADLLMAGSAGEAAKLDTISWYDDSCDHLDPDWNESPYFRKVEERRGRRGYHISLRELKDFAAPSAFLSALEGNYLAVTPACRSRLDDLFKRYGEHMKSEGHRVCLSGFGGDDILGGGIPSPFPELQDLAASLRILKFREQLRAWARRMRRPQLSLMREALVAFLPSAEMPTYHRPAPWFEPEFVNRNRESFCRYPPRVTLLGPSPTFQMNMATLDYLRSRIDDAAPHPDLIREVRWPYLDRDLLEFAFAIPREQLVRLGQRRSLMKRALTGIVPDEILKRRRTAFVPPRFRRSSVTRWPTADRIGNDIISASMGVIDRSRFLSEVEKARHEETIAVQALERTLKLEFWLRHLVMRRVLVAPMAVTQGRCPFLVLF